MARFHPLPAAALLGAALLLVSVPARAACVNKYVHQRSAQKVSFTLLTGKITFEEAKGMAEQIAAGREPAVEWIGQDGKAIARQFGPLKVVRPMPVSCDDKPSGVVLQAVFPTFTEPAKVVRMRFPGPVTVDFVAQSD